MKPTSFLNCLLFVCIIFTSCRREGPTPQNPNSGSNVYICGLINNNTFAGVPVYWKNGVQVVLSDSDKTIDPTLPLSSRALVPKFIVLSGHDVYVAGGELGAVNVYFKNGVRNIIGVAGSPAMSSFFVFNNDVYVAGSNLVGNPIFLSDSLESSTGYKTEQALGALQIAVSGQNVYFTAKEFDTIPYSAFLGTANLVGYWKNDVRSLFGNESILADPTGIAVSGQGVYVCGITNLNTSVYGDTIAPLNITSPRGIYWKNGKPVFLGVGTTSGIAVLGDDVYVCGNSIDYSNYNNTAIYWKNGIKTVLSSNNASTTGIAVSGNDVYISGKIGDYAVYWKNGVVDTLGKGGASAITIGN
jgi:hypothetical protein